MKLNKIKKGLKHPIASIIILGNFEKFKFIPDKRYISLIYSFYFEKKPNLKNPKTFNEKLQWLKLYDRKPEYTIMVDKYKVREYIANKIGKEYLIPLLGVWKNAEEIDFEKLPNQFVLKCNHNSGTGMCICRNKDELDIDQVRRDLNKGLNENYYYLGREWPYKNVQRRIIAEKYMVDESGDDLKDYKVLCFNGKPKLIEVFQGRFKNCLTVDYYDLEWKKTTITQGNLENFSSSTIYVQKPICLQQMIEFSRLLSKNIPQVRIDWYCIDGKLYFGEITFFDGSGFDPYDNIDDDSMLGEWIKLP